MKCAPSLPGASAKRPLNIAERYVSGMEVRVWCDVSKRCPPTLRQILLVWKVWAFSMAAFSASSVARSSRALRVISSAALLASSVTFAAASVASASS
jgi:hypothetical protein